MILSFIRCGRINLTNAEDLLEQADNELILFAQNATKINIKSLNDMNNKEGVETIAKMILIK